MDMLALPQIDFLWMDDAPDAGVPQAADERRETHCPPTSKCQAWVFGPLWEAERET
jgi:hypothetical protein